MGFVHWPMDRFLSRLASSDPAPGGGSAAALTGSLGAALGSMVCAILLGRPRLRAAERKHLQRDRKALERIRRGLARLIEEDAKAYHALVRALRTQKGILQAREKAIRCPLEICEAATEAGRIMRGLARKTGPYLGSDVKAGWALLQGAFESACETAEVNLRGADRSRDAMRIRRRLEQLRNLLER